MKKFIQGFTLIEMLIVVAVIAILAGVVLTGVTGFQASARDTRRIGDLRNTQNLLELYFNRCGHYPGDASCGNANLGAGDWGALTTAIDADGDAPLDPVTGRTYEYGSAGENLEYALQTTLERDNSVLNTDNDGHGLLNCDEAAREYCVTN